MPFTPTHILAVVPLARLLPLSALAIGSMVPDTAYFFPVVDYSQAHSLPGLLSTCLPLGVIILLIYEILIKEPVYALLPSSIQTRLNGSLKPKRIASLSFWLYASLAIVLGAATHLFWDSFTHGGRWGTTTFPSLGNSVSIAGRELLVYKAFQYGSTLVGLPALGLITFIAILRSEPSDAAFEPAIPAHWKWVAASLLAVTPLIAAAVCWNTTSSLAEWVGTSIRYTGVFVAGITLLYAIGFQALTQGSSHRSNARRS